MHSRALTLEKNSVILFCTEILFRVFAMILTLVVARKLGVSNFGLLEFAYTLAGTSLILCNTGLDDLTVRELAKRPNRAGLFLANMSFVRTLLYVPALMFCSLFIFFTSSNSQRMLVVILVFLVVVVQQHLFFCCSFFRAAERMVLEASVRIGLSFLLLLSGLIILLAGFGLNTLIVSRLVISVACLTMTIYWIKKYFRIQISRVKWRYLKIMGKMAASLVSFYVFVSVYLSFNVLFLNYWRGDSATGYYAAGFKLYTLFLVLAYGISTASLPTLSRNWVVSRTAFFDTFQRSVRYILLLAVALSVGTYFLADKAIDLLYGPEFTESVAVLQILGTGLFPAFLTNVFTVALISMKRDKIVLLGGVIGAAVCLASCILLIPRWALNGAAVALVIPLYAVLFFQAPFIFHECNMFRSLVTALKATFSAVLMAGGLLLAIRVHLPLGLIILVSVMLYASGLLLLKELKFREIKKTFEVAMSVGCSGILRR